MTRHEQIVDAFRRNGNHMTLGEMLQFPWGYKAASRMSELRRMGYHFVCEKKDKASDNLYRLLTTDENGQFGLPLS